MPLYLWIFSSTRSTKVIWWPASRRYSLGEYLYFIGYLTLVIKIDSPHFAFSTGLLVFICHIRERTWEGEWYHSLDWAKAEKEPLIWIFNLLSIPKSFIIRYGTMNFKCEHDDTILCDVVSLNFDDMESHSRWYACLLSQGWSYGQEAQTENFHYIQQEIWKYRICYAMPCSISFSVNTDANTQSLSNASPLHNLYHDITNWTIGIKIEQDASWHLHSTETVR